MKGLGTSPGIGIGRVFLYKEQQLTIDKERNKDPDSEFSRFDIAIEKAGLEMERLNKLTLKKIGEKEAAIFSAQHAMLQDPHFIESVKVKMLNEKISAEFAVSEVINEYLSLFNKIEDEYLKERASDFKDVLNIILRILLGIKSINLDSIEQKSIIVAKDISPSDIAQINKEKVMGLVTEVGGKTSHTAIMGRTLEIPVVSGLRDVTSLVEHGDYMIIDGESGDIIINPSKEEIMEYQNRIQLDKELKKRLNTLKYEPSLTKDGYSVEITGNIGEPKDVEKVIENGGEGVGLYRTEFLYMNTNKLPSEDEQFEAYKSVSIKLKNKPVIIRTLDVGGDKELPYLNLPKEDNPFLGYRAIRLCLDRQDIFRTQLRAILRASAFGNIRIMFPMVSSIEEIRDSKLIIEELKRDLRNKNISFNENIEIGIMVEIPAVAIHSRSFAKEVDFFSIGTNDLIQYTVAVDRGNQELAHLYTPYHPAILNLINLTIINAHKEGIKVGMCGEVASDEKLLPVLVGMGLDEFSMNPSSILKIRSKLKEISKNEINTKLDILLNLPTSSDVERFIDKNFQY